MTGMTLARRGAIASSGARDWFSEMEFYVDFTTKALDNNINGMLADSGQTITSNPGADSEAVAQIVDSPIDGKRALRVLDTDADTSYTHNTVELGTQHVFQRFEFRWDDEGATDYSVMAQIAWENWIANNATTASPNHVLFTRTAVVAQTYASLAATTMFTHVLDSELGNENATGIVAIDPNAGAVAVVCPDGYVFKYTTPSATNLEPETSDHEFGRIIPSTDTFAEILKMGSTSLAGMTPAVFAAYDEILVSQGLGSAYVPTEEITQLDVDVFASVNQDPTPAEASVFTETGSGENRCTIVYVSVTAQSTAGALSGHTRTATLGGVAMTSCGAAYVNNNTTAPSYWIEAFKLEDLDSHSLAGSQQLIVQTSKASENYRIRGVVATYSSTASVDAANIQTGTGASTPTPTISSETDDVVIIGFIAAAAAATADYDGTVITNYNYSGGPYPNAPMLVEQLPGAATVSDALTRGTANVAWASITLNLNKAT